MNTSYIIKTNIINFLRFRYQIGFIATECGNGHSDILYIHKNEVHEVEIKTSYSDFLADFKKQKHTGPKTIREYTEHPKYFSFAVTDNIFEKCNAYLEEKQLYQYGIMIVSTNVYHPSTLLGLCRTSPRIIVNTYRKPSKLHDKNMHELMPLKIARRMASENAKLMCLHNLQTKQ